MGKSIRYPVFVPVTDGTSAKTAFNSLKFFYINEEIVRMTVIAVRVDIRSFFVIFPMDTFLPGFENVLVGECFFC